MIFRTAAVSSSLLLGSMKKAPHQRRQINRLGSDITVIRNTQIFVGNHHQWLEALHSA